MEQLTAIDVIELVAARAQWCRENGESDMRIFRDFAAGLRQMVTEGKSRDEILASFADDEDDA